MELDWIPLCMGGYVDGWVNGDGGRGVGEDNMASLSPRSWLVGGELAGGGPERKPYRNAHARSRARVTSMGGLYDTATLHAPPRDFFLGR